ncbi:hypothetical protein Tco_0428385 [Tanacetum coccineum]
MTPSKTKSTNSESEGDDVSQLRVERDPHEVRVNEKGQIHNFTSELRMTPIKEISMNRESEGDDEKLRVEGEHHEEKVNEKRKINNLTLKLGITPIKEISTNRESEGGDEGLSSYIKYFSQLSVEGDHHEEKVDEKRKIHNFTPKLRITPIKEISMNRESEGADESKP